MDGNGFGACCRARFAARKISRQCFGKTLAAWILAGLTAIAGCGGPPASTPMQIALFNKAGSASQQVDVDQVIQARKSSGPYRVIEGDVLEFQLPALARGNVSMPRNDSPVPPAETFLFRVGGDGKIVLPVGGELGVVGKTIPEIESMIVEAYWPKYLLNKPAVVGKVSEYRSFAVTVVGAVKDPGTHQLHHDEMTLVMSLMKAGGVIEDGAGSIRITHVGESQQVKTVALPIRGLNVPFADVEISAGDIVEVMRLDPQSFSVTGLVNRGGNFPIPPGTQYTLVQALAMAGGLLDKACPEMATIYRRDEQGQLLSANFRLSSRDYTRGSSNVIIKPGDVVAVEPTPATQTRMFFSDFFRFGFGMGANYGLNN